jgi:hypothetical protein
LYRPHNLKSLGYLDIKNTFTPPKNLVINNNLPGTGCDRVNNYSDGRRNCHILPSLVLQIKRPLVIIIVLPIRPHNNIAPYKFY